MAILILSLAFVALGGLLVWFMLTHDHGKTEPAGALWAVFGLGFAGGIAASIIENLVLPKGAINAPQREAIVPLLLAMLAVGVIEETCKFVPTALLIYKKPYFNRVVDGVIFFAIAGLGFGIPENIGYTLLYGAGVGLTRLILTPLLHACTTAIVGYYLARSKVKHEPKTKTVMVLVTVMALHGLYDFGLVSGNGFLVVMSLAITLTLAAMLFVLYHVANETDVALGLTVPRPKSYCPRCGMPNASNRGYCVRCGTLLKLSLRNT